MSDDYNPFDNTDPRNQPGGDDLPLVNAYLKIPEHDRLRRALAYGGLAAEVKRLSAENKTVIAQLGKSAVAHIESQRSICDQRNRYLAERDEALAEKGVAVLERDAYKQIAIDTTRERGALSAVIDKMLSDEAIERAAIALYEDTRETGYAGAEWDWPNIDKSYDYDDDDYDADDEPHPEWLRNRYRATARVAITAVLAAGLAAPVGDPTCFGGDFAHEFEPGVDTDMEAEGRSPDPRWCDVCGESRVAAPVAEPEQTPEDDMLRERAEWQQMKDALESHVAQLLANLAHEDRKKAAQQAVIDALRALCEEWANTGNDPGDLWLDKGRADFRNRVLATLAPVGETPDEPPCDMCASGEHYMAANDPLCLCCGAPRHVPAVPGEEQER